MKCPDCHNPECKKPEEAPPGAWVINYRFGMCHRRMTTTLDDESDEYIKQLIPQAVLYQNCYDRLREKGFDKLTSYIETLNKFISRNPQLWSEE